MATVKVALASRIYPAARELLCSLRLKSLMTVCFMRFPPRVVVSALTDCLNYVSAPSFAPKRLPVRAVVGEDQRSALWRGQCDVPKKGTRTASCRCGPSTF